MEENIRNRQDQFVAMIKMHERLILKVCALYTDCQRYELGDLYQDAVCAMWESYASFNNSSKPSTWIYAVTRYTMMNKMRKKSIRFADCDETQMNEAQSDGRVDHSLDDVRDAVAMLKPGERDIFIMWMEGFTISEIAKVMNLTYTNTAVKINRMKNKLKKMIQP